jgi:hypothetical protein
MEPFHFKLVAVIDKSASPGRAMNTLAHLALGLGASYPEKAEFRLTDYADADGNHHDRISEIPFIVLEGSSGKIRELRQEASRENISFVDYTDAMVEGTFEDQIRRSAQTREADLNYLGIVLFGDWSKVSSLTKKFSLWK